MLMCACVPVCVNDVCNWYVNALGVTCVCLCDICVWYLYICPWRLCAYVCDVYECLCVCVHGMCVHSVCWVSVCISVCMCDICDVCACVYRRGMQDDKKIGMREKGKRWMVESQRSFSFFQSWSLLRDQGVLEAVGMEK